MNKFKKLLALLLCVFLLTSLSVSVSAGSAIDKIGKNTFAETINGSYWNNANEDVTVNDGKIIFGKETSEYTKLISTKIANVSNYYDNILDGNILIKFNSLPRDTTFILAFGLSSIESEMGDSGNVEVAFTNNGAVCAEVFAYNDDGDSKRVASKKQVGAIGQELNVEFVCATDGKLTLTIGGVNLCTNAQTGNTFLGRFGFLQNGTTNIEISDVNVSIYNYHSPENVNINENFNNGEYNSNAIITNMTAHNRFPAAASVGDHNGQKALIWQNCNSVYLSTRYKYSNVEISYDVLWQQNTFSAKDGVIISRISPGHSIRLGCDSITPSSLPTSYGVSFSVGDSNQVSATGGRVYRLNEHGINYSDPETQNKGYSVKITMINNVATIYLKWLNDKEFIEIGSFGEEDALTPNGFIQIVGGEATNIVFDNLKITNLDAKPNLADVEYKSNDFRDELKDYDYTPMERVYLEISDDDDNGFNLYLITAVAAGITVIGVAIVVLIVLLNKRKKKSVNIESIPEETVGETADE